MELMDKYNGLTYPVRTLWGDKIYRYLVEVKIIDCSSGKILYYTSRREPCQFIEEMKVRHVGINVGIKIYCNGSVILDYKNMKKMMVYDSMDEKIYDSKKHILKTLKLSSYNYVHNNMEKRFYYVDVLFNSDSYPTKGNIVGKIPKYKP